MSWPNSYKVAFEAGRRKRPENRSLEPFLATTMRFANQVCDACRAPERRYDRVTRHWSAGSEGLTLSKNRCHVSALGQNPCTKVTLSNDLLSNLPSLPIGLGAQRCRTDERIRPSNYSPRGRARLPVLAANLASSRIRA